VIGVRAAGEYIDSSRRGTPFFRVSRLSGAPRTCAATFKIASSGKSKYIVGGEYRLRLFNFHFFHFWNVKVDGVDSSTWREYFSSGTSSPPRSDSPASTLPETNDKLRVSYGPGLRLALGEAFVAASTPASAARITGAPTSPSVTRSRPWPLAQPD